MQKLGLAFGLLLLGLVPAQPQSAGWPPPAGAIAFLCVYNTVLPTMTNGQVGFVQCDSSGRPIVVATISGGGDATAANQVLQIAQETAFNTALGLMADAACATDNGTCSTIALIKRGNQRLTTVIAGIPVTNAGTFAVQAAVTAASGSFASGSQPIGITPTDRTVTSATGASQTLMSALATRKGLVIENTGNANCGINLTGGTAAIGGAGTMTLVPFGSYGPTIPTLSAITAICTAGQPLYAHEQ